MIFKKFKLLFKINSLMERPNAMHYRDFTTVKGVLPFLCVVSKTSSKTKAVHRMNYCFPLTNKKDWNYDLWWADSNDHWLCVIRVIACYSNVILLVLQSGLHSNTLKLVYILFVADREQAQAQTEVGISCRLVLSISDIIQFAIFQDPSLDYSFITAVASAAVFWRFLTPSLHKKNVFTKGMFTKQQCTSKKSTDIFPFRFSAYRRQRCQNIPIDTDPRKTTNNALIFMPGP